MEISAQVVVICVRFPMTKITPFTYNLLAGSFQCSTWKFAVISDLGCRIVHVTTTVRQYIYTCRFTYFGRNNFKSSIHSLSEMLNISFAKKITIERTQRPGDTDSPAHTISSLLPFAGAWILTTS